VVKRLSYFFPRRLNEQISFLDSHSTAHAFLFENLHCLTPQYTVTDIYVRWFKLGLLKDWFGKCYMQWMGVAPHPWGAGGPPPFSLTALLLMLAKASTQLTMHTHPSAGVVNLLKFALSHEEEECPSTVFECLQSVSFLHNRTHSKKKNRPSDLI